MIIQLKSNYKNEETKTNVCYVYHRNNHNYKYILIWFPYFQFELFTN